MIKTLIHNPRTEKLCKKRAHADISLRPKQAPHFIDIKILMFSWLQTVTTCATPARQHILTNCAGALRPQQASHLTDIKLPMFSWLQAVTTCLSMAQ
jgi:hypothetical protein